MNKLGIIGYLPPARIYPTDAFMQNMRDFPPVNPLVLFSDEYEGAGVIKLGGSVEIAKTENNRMAVNNLIFLVGVRIAATKGFTHILLVENDCRVNVAGWDKIIFDEFLKKNPEAICGGSLAIFNPCSFNHAASQEFEKFLFNAYPTRPVPLSITGSSNLAEHRDSCVFPNGALAIYRMDWLMKNFPEITQDTQKYVEVAQKIKTWDYEIGIRLWNEFKENTYKKVVHFDCIYSGYGNVMTSEEQRKELLNSKKVVAIHQIKSDWIPATTKPALPNIPLESVPENMELKSKKKPIVEIFYVTYRRDFEYLKYSLKSIEKFAKGFSGVTILVPHGDLKELKLLCSSLNLSLKVTCKSGYEWVGKGFLWHEAQKCRADEWCKKADIIAHLDPDVVFTASVTPETFFHEGKPLLRYEPFSSLAKREPNIWNWKIAVENALPFNCPDEGMRGFSHLYFRNLYPKVRELVEQKTGMSFNNYYKSCKNSFPQTAVDFPLLSAVALEKFRGEYHTHDCSTQENPDLCPYPVFQAWSHNPPEMETEVWYNGKKQKIVPLEIYKSLGIS